MIKKILVCLWLILLFAFSCWAEAPLFDKVLSSSNIPELKQLIQQLEQNKEGDVSLLLGIAYYNLCSLKQYQYLNQAMNLLDTVYKKTKNPLALGYYGSAVTLVGAQAASAKNLIVATTKVEEGSKLIDQAVQLDPNDIYIRVLRISNAVGVSESSPFNRYDIAKKDLAFLKSQESKLPDPIKSFYYLNQGKILFFEKKTNEAIDCFEKAAKIAPYSIYAKTALNLLDQLEE